MRLVAEKEKQSRFQSCMVVVAIISKFVELNFFVSVIRIVLATCILLLLVPVENYRNHLMK